MAQQIALEVVTPTGAVVNEDVDIVNAPGYGGDFGVLANHAPFLSTIKIGILSYETGKKREHLMISGGFCEVSNNKIIVKDSQICGRPPRGTLRTVPLGSAPPAARSP